MLHVDILEHIASFLRPSDVASLRLACKECALLYPSRIQYTFPSDANGALYDSFVNDMNAKPNVRSMTLFIDCAMWNEAAAEKLRAVEHIELFPNSPRRILETPWFPQSSTRVSGFVDPSTMTMTRCILKCYLDNSEFVDFRSYSKTPAQLPMFHPSGCIQNISCYGTWKGIADIPDTLNSVYIKFATLDVASLQRLATMKGAISLVGCTCPDLSDPIWFDASKLELSIRSLEFVDDTMADVTLVSTDGYWHTVDRTFEGVRRLVLGGHCYHDINDVFAVCDMFPFATVDYSKLIFS